MSLRGVCVLEAQAKNAWQAVRLVRGVVVAYVWDVGQVLFSLVCCTACKRCRAHVTGSFFFRSLVVAKCGRMPTEYRGHACSTPCCRMLALWLGKVRYFLQHQLASGKCRGVASCSCVSALTVNTGLSPSGCLNGRHMAHGRQTQMKHGRHKSGSHLLPCCSALFPEDHPRCVDWPNWPT